jgi:hypothetical protein
MGRAAKITQHTRQPFGFWVRLRAAEEGLTLEGRTVPLTPGSPTPPNHHRALPCPPVRHPLLRHQQNGHPHDRRLEENLKVAITSRMAK